MPIFLFVLILGVNNMSQARVVEFGSTDEANNWYISNDTVMGGVSRSRVDFNDETLLFSGNLSLDNNGGFASTFRYRQHLGLDNDSPLIIRVKGDGRRYQLRLRTPQARGLSYKAEFATLPGSWVEHAFIAQDFTATWRGRWVSNAPQLQFDQVNALGFLLADKVEGEFELAVAKVYQAAGAQYHPD